MQTPTSPSADLDPADWEAFRRAAHHAVDQGLDHLQQRREARVWTPMPEALRYHLAEPLPEEPTPLQELLDEFFRDILPHSMGNDHPRFFGWYMGGSTASGALADFLAAIEASNLGGGDTAAAAIDTQVCRWLVHAMGFPAQASASLVSSGSLANLVALAVSRNAMAGVDVREIGITQLPQALVFYGSHEVHSSSQKAIETLGLGHRALRKVPVDAALRMDLVALERMVAEDRAAGRKPSCVIGTAGTTSTGSIDNLNALADFCQQHQMWFHVDGAIGAVLKLSSRHAGLVAGLERADSVALDLHKWAQVPFACGAAIVRDGEAHFATFNLHPPYLQEQTRGLAAAPFLADRSLDLTRGFIALKVWMTIREHGRVGLARLIDHQIALAANLAAQLQADPQFELTAPQVLNIVCYRHRGLPGMGEDEIVSFNTELMLRIQESGVAVPTDTTLGGRFTLRAALVNHRVQAQDVNLLVETLKHHAAALLQETIQR